MTALRFDALVFDFDGVLVESVDVKTRAFAALYSGYGPEVVRKVIAYHLEHGGLSRFEKFRYFHRQLLGLALSAAEEHSLGERFATIVEDAVVAAPWVRGAVEFLEAFHAKLPLFVASGTPDDELQRIVARRGMRHFFAGIRGSPASKAKILADFVAAHVLRPARVLMIGDSSTDWEGAREAGTSFLAVTRDPGARFAATLPSMPDLVPLASFVEADAVEALHR